MKFPRRNPARKSRNGDMVLRLAGAVAVALLLFFPFRYFESVQYRIYDWSLKVRGSRPIPEDMTIVAIDDQAIAQVGRWPWPRSKLAELIDRLSEGKAKLIAVDIVFPPAETEGTAGPDRLLGEATTRAGKVLYPYYFSMERAKGEGRRPTVPPQVMNTAYLLFDDPKKFFDLPTPSGTEVFAPSPEICRGAIDLGHINVLPDPDGKVRWDPLIVEFAGQYFPSFSLQIAAAAMKLTRGDITVRVGQSIQLGKRRIPTNPQGMMLIHYYGGARTLRYYSASEVLSGKSPAEAFKDKIVLVGVTAAGISAGAHDFMATPFSNRFSGVEKHVHEVASILQGLFISRPSWVPFGEFGLVMVLGILLAFLLPGLRPAYQLVLSLAILAGLGGVAVGAIRQGIWVKTFFPGLVVVLQYILTAVRPEPATQKSQFPKSPTLA